MSSKFKKCCLQAFLVSISWSNSVTLQLTLEVATFEILTSFPKISHRSGQDETLDPHVHEPKYYDHKARLLQDNL